MSFGIRILVLNISSEKEKKPLNKVGPGKAKDMLCVSDEISYSRLTSLFASVRIINPFPFS